jgi:hypothetical protein
MAVRDDSMTNGQNCDTTSEVSTQNPASSVLFDLPADGLERRIHEEIFVTLARKCLPEPTRLKHQYRRIDVRKKSVLRNILARSGHPKQRHAQSAEKSRPRICV